MRSYRRVMIAVALLAAVFVAAPAFAQTQQRQVNTGLGIGALGGINWTTVRTENETGINFDAGTGWQLGLWVGGNRDGRAGLLGEFSYAKKKVNDEFNGEFERTYVQIPVLLRVNAGSRERDKPSLYFLVGPVFDIQINTKEDGVDAPDDVYEGLEIGILGGVGFEVFRIGIEGRYQWGLRSVLATDAAEESGFGSTKLNSFSVVAKIRFN